MKHNLRLAAAAIMSTSLALFTAPTFANDLPEAPSSSDALAAVRDLGDNRVKQPVPDEESPADIPSAGGEAISLAGTDFAIAVPGTKSAEQYEDVTVIEGSQPGTTTVVQPTKAGVQIMAVLDSPQSNQEQKYDLDIPNGGHAVTQSDGSVLVLDAMDRPAVAIRAPWAEDSDGKALPTYFTISGSTLTQHVDTRDAQFPVVADPNVETAWWGWQIGFTNKQTNKLIKGIVASSTAAGLLSFMSASGIISSPGAIPTGLASGFLALGAAALECLQFQRQRRHNTRDQGGSGLVLAKRVAGIAFMVALALMTAILLASLVIDNPALQQTSDAVVYLAIATIAIYLTWLHSRRKEIRKRR